MGEEAWNMKSFIVPLSGLLILAFFYVTHQLSDYPTVVKVGFGFYFAFLLFSKDLGFTGQPKKTYEAQIEANADPGWNDEHLFLHIYYLVILWGVALTVPYGKLSSIRASRYETAATTTATNGLTPSDPSNTTLPGATMVEVLKEAIVGEKLLPEFSTISQTSKFLILQGIIYGSTGLTLYLFPGLFNKMMLFPRPYTELEEPLYRCIGFCTIGIGYFYIMTSRMNNNYWAVATIFTRMTMTPFCCIVLWLFFGGEPRLCITFAILDPTLGYLTYLSLMQDEKAQYSSLA